ncbi:MAG: aspartate 1-decarboxylase [Gammaproteobacteria bacterium]|nr:aspartate 1-decarboxylase [Gammaproteobacteria bacterium]
MRRVMLRAKLHRVSVTHSELDYEGSVAIDGRLLDAADVREYERVDIYNIRNGERFSTYAIRAREDSGIISINGAAAHKANPGDLVIIAAYGEFDEAEVGSHEPRLLYVDSKNRITHTRNAIPVQAA